MKLTNYKTYCRWCELNGFDPDGLLGECERWAMECSGNYGIADISYETGYRDVLGNMVYLELELVKPAHYNEIFLPVYRMRNSLRKQVCS